MIVRGLLLAALLLLAACAKPVPQDHAALVGEWRGGGITLLITADGQAEYVKVQGKGRVSINGPIHDINGSGFKVGLGPLSAGFRIDQPPSLRNGRWTMVVDGVELSRDGPGLLEKSPDDDQKVIST